MIDFNEAKPFGALGLRIDLDAVAARLRDTAEHWVPRLFPSGKKCGKEWRVANIQGYSPSNHGSCTIQLQGDHAGEWYEFDGGKGGGVISAVGHATGLSGRFLIEYAAELAGWKQGDKAPKPSTPSKAKSPKKTNNDIQFILSQCKPAAESITKTYLASRGLSHPATPDILFHPDLTHWETKMGYPAMVGVVRNAQGGVIGLHRTWLKADGSGKADIQKPKMMLGPCSGGAVRLSETIGEVIGIAEGIETALAVQNARPQLPIWAALSTSGMERVVLPPSVRRIVLLADNDKSGAGLKAANATAAKLAATGRRAWIAMPPREGEDFNDLLQHAGAEAVRKALDEAWEWKPVASAEPELSQQEIKPSAPDIKHLPHKPFGFSEPTGVRPMLRADNGDLAKLSDECWSVLYGANDPPWLFRFSMRMTWIDTNDEAQPKPQFVTEDRLKFILARQIDWRKEGKEALIPAHPPGSVIKDILATPNTRLPVLGGIVATPVFGPEGKLIATPGYHALARLMYAPHKAFVLPPIPAKPTAADTKAARELLLDDLLGDFPFTGDAERAHALALLLLPFMRPMIDGPTPVHLIEKPSAGTGGTLMVEAIAHITTGAGANLMSGEGDEDEWRKRLTSALRVLPTLFIIDNLKDKLDSAAFAAAVTATSWEDRILGKSEMVSLPVRCVWVVTGNNPAISHEIARRSIRIRLDSRADEPWLRRTFRHANLIAWVKENRSRLVAACLTLGQAWVAAGRPLSSQSIGSFENWAQIIGGVLEVAGVPGFLGNLHDLYEASDAEGTLWRGFVTAWWERFKSAEVCVSDLYRLAEDRDIVLPLGDGNERSRLIRLGKHVAKLRDRTFRIEGEQTVRVLASGTKARAQLWRLVPSEKSEPEKHSQHSPHSPEPAMESECSAQHSSQHSLENDMPDQGVSECHECCEFKSNPYTRAHAYAPAHAHTKNDTEKHSSHSQHSSSQTETMAYASECSSECPNGHSTAPESPPRLWPAWLEGMEAQFSPGMAEQISNAIKKP